ncbi:MAG: histidine--tRNA ligase [Desulfurococcales archaeon]|nr:histidine--tRNA ligase [Desulfurococcales archaeon]
MSKIQLNPVRGMRDILPPDSEEIIWLESTFADVLRSYGYSAVIVPTVELFKLFEVKSGPEISRSMYVFDDKAGRRVCLRPEFTAGVVRLYLRSLTVKPKPVKLYYFGSAFRYEEPQKGRFREFIQAGVEYVGDASVFSDIELLLTIRDYYRAVGLRNYEVKMNSVGIYRKMFRRWGVPEDVQDLVIHYLDKGELDNALEELRKYPEAEAEVVESLSGLRVEDPEKLDALFRELRLPNYVEEDFSRLRSILEVAKNVGVGNPYIDLGFARGLAYYTGFIFEVKTPYLNFSIGGGGRYDTLISLYGGSETPSTGYSLGIDRLHIALKASGWSFPASPRRLLLICMGSDVQFADEVSTRLRKAGFAVDVRFRKKVSEMLSYASKEGFDYVGIVGAKEFQERAVTIKNLRTREQRKVPVDMLGEVELP